MTAPSERRVPRAPLYDGSNPIFGAGLDFMRAPLELLTSLSKTYPDIVRIRLVNRVVHVVNSPDLAKRVVQSGSKKYAAMEYVNSRLRFLNGETLFTAEGLQWQGLRRLMQPSFGRGAIGRYARVVGEEAHRMADTMLAAEGKELSVAEATRDATFNMVSRILSGVDMQQERELRDALAVASDFLGERLRNPLAPPTWVPTPLNLRVKRAIRTVDEAVRRIVQARRSDPRRHEDFLQVLLDARSEDTGVAMTAEQLENQILAFYFGGLGPPAKLLTWAFYHLGRNAAVEAKLHEEVDRVLGGRAPELEDMGRLPYTRMIVDEILRLYPTAWAMPRTAIAEDVLGSARIEVGDDVVPVIYTIHRNIHYWDDAETFDPERFNPENVDPRAVAARQQCYFPFGLGPRSCIANHLSLMILQLGLAAFAQRLRLRPASFDRVKPLAGFPLGPDGPVWMVAESRHAAGDRLPPAPPSSTETPSAVA